MSKLDDIMTEIIKANLTRVHHRDASSLGQLIIDWYKEEEISAAERGSDSEPGYDPDIEFENRAEIIGEQLRRERQFQIEDDYEEDMLLEIDPEEYREMLRQDDLDCPF